MLGRCLDDILKVTDDGRRIRKWTVHVRADGRTDIDAHRAARLLSVADLGGDLIELHHDQRRVTVQVLVEAASELSAYERVISMVRAVLDDSWIVVRDGW
jgi:hypothetical protein